MKTEEYKSIEDLLDRFFEGQTSNEEERVLYEFFARPDIPAHLERYREVFGYFESGIALDFSETPELRQMCIRDRLYDRFQHRKTDILIRK